jgi:DNA-binding GntR family transcriptional regulator
MTQSSIVPASAHESKADLAYEQIQRRITDGVYEPGSRLVLDRLARDLDMSTLPVREAIRRLEAEGYVQFQRNVGATVSRLDATSYVQALEALAVLEGAAIVQAAEHLDESDIRAAHALNAEMAISLEKLDGAAYVQLHDDFHALLTGRCSNAHLVDVITKERTRLKRVRHSAFALGAGGRSEIEDHERLLELIAAGAAPYEIEAFTRSHLTRASAALVGDT